MHQLLIDGLLAATVELRFVGTDRGLPRLRAGGHLLVTPAFDVLRPCFEGPPPLPPFRTSGAPSLHRPLSSFTLAIADAAGNVLPARRIRILPNVPASPSHYGVVLEIDDAAAGVWAASLHRPLEGDGHAPWASGADAPDA